MTVRAIKEAGGKITGDHSLIRAVFDENSLGFWIDILMFIETMINQLEEIAADLDGYSILAGKTLPEMPGPLCRFLSGGKGGFFLDQTAAEALCPYITIEEQGKWTNTVKKYGAGPFSRLKEIKIFVPAAKFEFPLQKPTLSGQGPGVFFANQSFEGKRDKLYQRAAGFNGSDMNEGFSPLFIRFGNGGLNAIIDAWAGWMHSVPAEEEMSDKWEFLFRNRLRDRPSPFAIRTANRFFSLLINSYRDLAQSEGKTPVIILENIQNAEQAAANIVIESLRGFRDFLLLGTCNGDITDTDMAKWKLLFPQLTKVNITEPDGDTLPDLPLDLWEIGYACLLFGRYFPPDLLPRLLEEAGKSPVMISRAFSLLYALKVIDTPMDPRPWHKQFQYHAEIALGERKDRIRAIVRGRLLEWAAQRKINPCLRLPEILKTLSEQETIDDNLILRSIRSEMACADNASFEHIRYNRLDTEADTDRIPIIHYLTETMIALHSGKVDAVHAVFAGHSPDSSSSPLFRAQILLNQSLYHIGLRDTNSAAKTVKEATMLCQKNSGASLLAQAYRLFALTSFLQRRIRETIDYLGFSLENAKSGEFQDIGMAAYYTASIQMLYGNLSRSKTLAEKARQCFLKAGSAEWADRSRFLLGRIAFETGFYREAADLFEDIRQNPEGARFPEKEATLKAWAYRAGMYCQTFHLSRPQSGGHDAQLFEIEALCLAGDFSAAAQLPGISAGSTEDQFLSIERADWRSGFSQCELLYFTGDDLRERIFNGYHSIAQSHISPAGGTEAINTIQRVLRSEQFSDIDPFDIFYHYAWYHILKQTEAAEVDISTVVNVAFRRLEIRANRIDDMETRRQYLTQPHWNKVLLAAAKEFKLI